MASRLARTAAPLLALFLLLLPAPAQAAWAVAYVEGGQPIVTRAMESVSAAEQYALANCNGMYGNCRIVGSANFACLALASDGVDKWGVGQDRRKAPAAEAALGACEATGARTCKVVHEFCGR